MRSPKKKAEDIPQVDIEAKRPDIKLGAGDSKTSKKGSKAIIAEKVEGAGADLGQAIKDLGTMTPPSIPESYVSKIFRKRDSGFKMKYNKNNFPFKE
tara:strand:- start:1630 stop:1920 length:291 start_codon:yes stop_codon:yes gene_type:complete